MIFLLGLRKGILSYDSGVKPATNKEGRLNPRRSPPERFTKRNRGERACSDKSDLCLSVPDSCVIHSRKVSGF